MKYFPEQDVMFEKLNSIWPQIHLVTAYSALISGQLELIPCSQSLTTTLFYKNYGKNQKIKLLIHQ